MARGPPKGGEAKSHIEGQPPICIMVITTTARRRRRRRARQGGRASFRVTRSHFTTGSLEERAANYRRFRCSGRHKGNAEARDLRPGGERRAAATWRRTRVVAAVEHGIRDVAAGSPGRRKFGRACISQRLPLDRKDWSILLLGAPRHCLARKVRQRTFRSSLHSG